MKTSDSNTSVETHEKIKTLKSKLSQAYAGGGAEKIKKHKQGSRLTARERIHTLLDIDSFVELDTFREHRSTSFGMENKKYLGDGIITGYGKIENRLVYVFSQDFTVLGGTMSRVQSDKISKIMDLALKNGAPIIGLNDSGGARIQEGIEALDGYADIFSRNTLASGVVPQISAIMGPCAGGAVYSPSLTDFIFMVKGSSYMFVTGPDVIKTVTHETITKEELGGASVHSTQSGVAHQTFGNDTLCLLAIRDLLSFLPSNNLEEPPLQETKDSAQRTTSSLNGFIPDDPKKSYDMKTLISSVVDDKTFFELQPYFAENIITGFARLDGKTIGVVANQPQVLAGCLNINASRKAARFVRFCDAFNIPILTLVDVPGFLPGKDQEWNGIITHGSKLLFAYAEATVPKVSLVTRKAYGGAYIVMSSKLLRGDINLAYPTAEIAVMGAEGAINIMFKKEIAASKQPEQTREKFIQDYKEQFSSPYQATQLGNVDQVIVPEETRKHLIQSFEMLQNKREELPKKKHGNIPL